jgi:hypothetical protein
MRCHSLSPDGNRDKTSASVLRALRPTLCSSREGKGDVARMLFYLDACYAGPDRIPGLALVDDNSSGPLQMAEGEELSANPLL